MEVKDGAFAYVDEEADIEAASAGGDLCVNDTSLVVGEIFRRESEGW